MKWIGLLVVAALAVGCGSDVSPKGPGTGVSINVGTNNNNADAGNNIPTGDGGTSTDGGGGVPDATMSSEDAPEILELSATPTTLEESGSVSISAIVTDPQGAGDIVAVRLLEQSSGTSLGNFSSDGGGAYSTSVSWSDLQNAIDITFDGSLGVILTAEAIDTAGERSTRSLSLTLGCSDANSACDSTCGEISCNGTCTTEDDFFGDNQNCGACGNSCGGSEICSINECLNTSVIGQACTSDSQCGGQMNSCQTEAATGIPGGLCLLICSQDGCGAGAECIGIQDRSGNNIPACLPTCNVDGDCRDGWTCQQAEGEGGVINVCFPQQPM